MMRAGSDRSRQSSTKTNPTKNPTPTPEEGLRLVRAFVRVRDQALREEILKFVEELSRLSGNETAEPPDGVRPGVRGGARLI